MSWHYLVVQGEESSEAVCSGGEPLPPLKSKTIHAEFYCNGKLMDSYLDSLSGTISGPLTEPHGEDELTLSAVDSHVRTFQLPEVAKESAERGQGSGQKCHGLLAKYDPVTHLWRTVQCSLLEDLNESLETLPKWGMTVDGGLYPLPTLVQNTNENEFGLWLTPTVMDGLPPRNPEALERQYQKNRKGRTTHSTLREQVVYPPPKEMWPTPNAWDGRRGPRSEENLRTKNHQINLITAIKMKERETFPTPNARDWKDSRTAGNRKSPGLGVIAHSGTSSGGSLSPDWTEWLMGWPIGWSDLKPLEMDKSPSALPQHGES